MSDVIDKKWLLKQEPRSLSFQYVYLPPKMTAKIPNKFACKKHNPAIKCSLVVSFPNNDRSEA